MFFFLYVKRIVVAFNSFMVYVFARYVDSEKISFKNEEKDLFKEVLEALNFVFLEDYFRDCSSLFLCTS